MHPKVRLAPQRRFVAQPPQAALGAEMFQSPHRGLSPSAPATRKTDAFASVFLFKVIARAKKPPEGGFSHLL